MKRSPGAAVRVAVAREQAFFRRYLRNSERVVLEEQLTETPAIDERSEEARPIRVIKIDQRAQLIISAERLAQQRFVVAIKITRMLGLWAARCHPGLRRRFDLFEGLVREAQHQTIEVFLDRSLVDEERQIVLFDFRRRRETELALADKDRADVAIVDRRRRS